VFAAAAARVAEARVLSDGNPLYTRARRELPLLQLMLLLLRFTEISAPL